MSGRTSFGGRWSTASPCSSPSRSGCGPACRPSTRGQEPRKSDAVTITRQTRRPPAVGSDAPTNFDEASWAAYARGASFVGTGGKEHGDQTVRQLRARRQAHPRENASGARGLSERQRARLDQYAPRYPRAAAEAGLQDADAEGHTEG